VAAAGRPDEPATAVLGGSRALARRRAEADAVDAADRARARHRAALRTRGVEAVPRRGEDPARDAAERTLQRIATRGVVRLFNAVAQAQRRRAEGNTSKAASAARLNRASFFGALEGTEKKNEKAEKSDGDGATGGGWDALRPVGVSTPTGAALRDWERFDRRGDPARAPANTGAPRSLRGAAAGAGGDDLGGDDGVDDDDSDDDDGGEGAGGW